MRKRIMAGFLSLLMIFGFMVRPSNGEAITGISERNGKTENLEALEATGQIEALEEMKTSINRGVKYKPEDEVTIIVELEGDTLVDSAPEAVGDFAVSTRGQALIEKIIEQHQRVKKEIDKKVDRVSFDNGYNYTAVMNGFTLKVPYKDLKTIESLRGVKRAYVAGSYDIPVTDSASETSSTKGGVSLSSDMINDTGYTGKGVAVAILDSGIDYNHEAFSIEPEKVKYSQEEMEAFIENSTDALSSGGEGEVISSKLIFSYDYADDDSDVMPNSGNEHGTHVAGTAAGNNGSDFLGVAPDAQLMIMKVFSNKNKGASEEDVLAALEDAVILGADVINMSLGASAGFTESAVEATKEMYQRIEKAGINLMVAAGNSYWQGYKITENNYPYGATPDYGIVSSPSTYGSSVSVASIESGEGGSMSGFSSWGTTPGLTLKPEITAPGEDIYSSVPGGGYKTYSGTSMAAPYMSGAAAVLKEYVNESFQEADSTEKMEIINNILMSTATPVVEYDYGNGTVDYYSPRKQGAGLVNIYNAINSGAYLYVGDNQRPKAELGDSTTGEYEFTFTIKNYSHEVKSYLPELQLQTDSPNPEDPSYNYLTSYTFLDGTGDEDEANITISWDNTLEESFDDFQYIKDTAAGTATITGYKGTGTVVIIPDKIDGYKVTTIGEAAFQGKEAITEVILPETITTIEKYAFLNTGIKEIVVDKNVTTIEDYSIGYTTASEVGRKITVLPLEEVEVTVEIELSDEVIDSFLEYFSNGFYVEGFMVLKSENDDEVDLSMPLLGFLGDWDSLELFDGTIYDGDSYYYSSQIKGMYYNSSEDSWFYYATLGENHITGEYDGENLSYSPYLASNKYGEDGYTYLSTDTGLLRNARDISYTISDSRGREIANYDYLFGADETKSYYYTSGAYV
ncbi:MAG: S8 family serine peptidase, partial [Clostridiaceae bacterium]